MQPLSHYLLHLADNALILAQRNAEWTGRGPILEQDIALSNIALDLIGQARMLYQYAAEIIQRSGEHPNQIITEDSLAFLRDENAYNNCLLVELEKGDWARTTLRQFFFSTYQLLLFGDLTRSSDTTIAAIAEKTLKEVRYHYKWSAEWVIRLGDGTAESKMRMETALADLWMYTGELTSAAAYETQLAIKAIAVDVKQFSKAWTEMVGAVFKKACLTMPAPCWMQTGGKQGNHSEQLGYILTEMQWLQRNHPDAEW